jgi:hypothetical protein
MIPAKRTRLTLFSSRSAISRGARVALFALACLTAPASQAQQARSQAPILTRLVKFYSDAEQRLAAAIDRKDKGEIDRLVAEDFELRSAANIGTPVPRADWIAQSFKEAPLAISITQMAVHEYSDVRIVSFMMTRTDSPHRAASFAVIDVWTQSAETSVLRARYATAQPAGSSVRVPGEIRQPQVEKRY